MSASSAPNRASLTFIFHGMDFLLSHPRPGKTQSRTQRHLLVFQSGESPEHPFHNATDTGGGSNAVEQKGER